MGTLQDHTEIQGVKFGTSWVGLVAPFAKSGSAPTGWLLCNGAAVSRSTYADLWGVCSTTWGAGDGNTTFNVPDMRGEFQRGWDNGRGVDSGRNHASAQAHRIGQCDYACWEGQKHYGGGQVAPEGWAYFQLKHNGYPNAYGGQPSILLGTDWYHSACGIGYNSGRWCINTGNLGNECRPRNMSVQFMIKY